MSVLRNFGLEVWISGGLTSGNEVEHCLGVEATTELKNRVIKGIQIGSWALLRTDLTQNNWHNIKAPTLPQSIKESKIQPTLPQKRGIKAFLPRFSFLNIYKCKACNHCSQTFYCDTFIDRIHTGLPPLMDSRYCNGCGLCAQICRSGALQLYPPENFIVLISSSRERKEILDRLKIPNLQYAPEKDENNFPAFLLQHEFIKNKSKENLTTFWAERIKKDKFMLHQDEEDLYPEERNERKDECIKSALELFTIAESCSKHSEKHAKTAMKRAAIWSQLIWSDPGQVLWDSFILTIQSVIMIEGEPAPNISVIGDLIDQTKTEKEFRMESWIVLLRKGDIILNGRLPGNNKYILVDSAKMSEDDKKLSFNQGRTAGLVRASGNHGGEHSFSLKDKLELAGLPWEEIKSKVNDLPQSKDEHKKAFEHLCLAVSERERI